MKLINWFAALVAVIILEIAFVSSACFSYTDSNAGSVIFSGFNRKKLEYNSGDEIQFKFKINQICNQEEYFKKGVKVNFFRERNILPDINLELINQVLIKDPKNPKVFHVSGIVPDVKEKRKFAIRISRSSCLISKKTMAKSDHSPLAIWKACWWKGKRKITISPRQSKLILI